MAFSLFEVSDLGKLSLYTAWNVDLSAYTVHANAAAHPFFLLPQKGLLPIKLICLSYGLSLRIISENYAKAQCCYQTEIESKLIPPDHLAGHVVLPESLSPQMLAGWFP